MYVNFVILKLPCVSRMQFLMQSLEDYFVDFLEKQLRYQVGNLLGTLLIAGGIINFVRDVKKNSIWRMIKKQ